MADDDKAVIRMEVDSTGVREGVIAGGKAITDEATKLLQANRARETADKSAEYARRRVKSDAEYYNSLQQKQLANTHRQIEANHSHAGGLAEMAKEFLAVGSAAALAKEGIDKWAETDKVQRGLAVASGDSVRAIKAYGPTLTELSTTAGMNVDKIAEAFDVLRDKSGKTFEDIVRKGLPAMVAAAKANNMEGQMNNLADVLGTAMNQFGLTEDQAMQFFDHIQAASDKMHLNLKELLPMMPQLMASMKKEGGGDGAFGTLDKLLATLAAVRYKGFGSTGEAAVAMQMRIENMTNSLADHGIGTQRQLLNSLEQFKKGGGDAIDWLLGKIDEFEGIGGNVKEIFEQRQLKFITALKAGRGEIATNLDALGKSQGLMLEAFNKMADGFGHTLDQMGARWNKMLGELGWGAEQLLKIFNAVTDIEAYRQQITGDTSNSEIVDKKIIELKKLLEEYKKHPVEPAIDPRNQIIPMKPEDHHGGHGSGHEGEHAAEEAAPSFPARRPLTSRGVRDDQQGLLQHQSYDDTDGSPRSLFRQIKSLDETMGTTNALLQKASYSSADKPSGGGYPLGGGGGSADAGGNVGYGGDSGNNQTSMPPTQPNRGGQRSASLAPGGSGGVDNSGDMPTPEGPVTARGGNAYLAEKRAGFRAQLQDPATRRLLGGVLQTENPGAGPAVVESLFNRTELVNEARAKKGLPPLTLKDMMLGHPSIGGGKSFYGPVRRGEIRGGMRAMDNPKTAAGLNRSIDQALDGSNTVESYTDQGSRGDPNYEKGGVGKNINRERFNNWGYPGSAQWRARRQAAIEQAERNKANTGMQGIGGEAARDRQPPQPQQSTPAEDAGKVREQLEEPILIRTKLDSSDVGFRRASMRRELDREMREARWNSFSDIGAA